MEIHTEDNVDLELVEKNCRDGHFENAENK
jgi:hypothetical protein